MKLTRRKPQADLNLCLQQSYRAIKQTGVSLLGQKRTQAQKRRGVLLEDCAKPDQTLLVCVWGGGLGGGDVAQLHACPAGTEARGLTTLQTVLVVRSRHPSPGGGSKRIRSSKGGFAN